MKINKLLKWTSAVLTAGIVFSGLGTLNAQAAPETMPDGTIFDAEYYASENPDVVAVMGKDANLLYIHYQVFGKNEGRLPVGNGTSTANLTPQEIEYNKIVDKLEYEKQYVNSVYAFICQSRDGKAKQVEFSPALSKVAEYRAAELNEKFSHLRLDNSDFRSALRSAKIYYEYEGECISNAANVADSTAYWQRTQSEMDTIMNNNYDKVGIAVENGYCAVIFTGGHTKEIGKD